MLRRRVPKGIAFGSPSRKDAESGCVPEGPPKQKSCRKIGFFVFCQLKIRVMHVIISIKEDVQNGFWFLYEYGKVVN